MRKIYLNKVSLAEAKQKFFGKFHNLRTEAEEIEVEKTIGRVSSEAVYARRSAPNFYASAMDGIAVKSEITAGASERNPVKLKKGKEAVFVDTGDPVPDDFDAVIKIENVVENEDIFEKDKSEIIKIDDKIELLLDPIHDEPRLVIFGSGHVAQPLAKIAKIAGFTVNVIDDREGLLNRGYFPTADSLIAREYNSFLEEYQARADDYIVIVTRGHQHDYYVLKDVIDSSAKYIGMIGSNHKVKLTFEQLKEEKEVSQEKIDEVDAPIGINLGSETPAEIAVSIMSKIISVRRGQNEA